MKKRTKRIWVVAAVAVVLLVGVLISNFAARQRANPYRRLILDNLYPSERGCILMTEDARAGWLSGDCPDYAGNFTAGLLLPFWFGNPDLDVECLEESGWPFKDLREMAAHNARAVIRPEDIKEIRILAQSDDTVTGEFTWSVPGLLRGRGLFVARRETNEWQLAYLGIPRKGSDNPTHGYSFIPAPGRATVVMSVSVALAGSIPSAPTNDWCVINISRTGELVDREGYHSEMTSENLNACITDALVAASDIILRCDRDCRSPVIGATLDLLISLGVEKVWFAGRGGHPPRDIFVDVVLLHDVAPTGAEFDVLVRDRAFEARGVPTTPADLAEDLKAMPDLDRVHIMADTNAWLDDIVQAAFSARVDGGKDVYLLLDDEP